MPQDLHSLRIALADDDDISLRYTEHLLRTLGHRVVVLARDGCELIAGCAERKIDLVIADIRMPKVDGVDAIRKIYARQPVPVILLSGHIDREVLDRASQELVLAYLVKPIKPADIGPTISTAIRRFADIQRLRREAAVLSLARSESLRLVAAGIATQSAAHFRKIIDHCLLLETYATADERALRLVKAMRVSASHVARIATALHDYTGANIRESVPLSLTDLVIGACDLVESVASKSFELQYDLQPDLLLIFGDANKLRESLLNLVINGLEAYGSEGGLLRIATGAATLSTSEQESIIVGTPTLDTQYVFLEVCDSGSGMDRATVQRMFDPFFTTKFLGRGLGLPAVAGVVRSHDGVIAVESQPGAGTLVRLYFPAIFPDPEST